MSQQQGSAPGEDPAAQPKKSERDDPNQRHLYEDITEKEYQPDGHTFTSNEPSYKPTHEDIRLNPGRSVMPNAPKNLPPQMNIFANIAEIVKVRSKPLHDCLLWFYNKVKDGGKWDYKRKNRKHPLQWEDAGNYYYGFAGTILGIPPELLKRAAGGAHLWSATKRYWKNLIKEKDTDHIKVLERGRGVPFGKPPYGDDPKDQYQVKRGIQDGQEFLRRHGSQGISQ